jgi:hypothetical protein
MATEAQILANRRNARLSTGPRTPTGRARSAMNATKSGIYAKSETIPGEDPAELEALKTRIYDSIQPSPEEVLLVDQLIGADWQLRRLRRAEADVWTNSMTIDKRQCLKKGTSDEMGFYARTLDDNKDSLDRIYRYQTATARILHRSLDTLLRLRKLDLLQSQGGPALSPINPEPLETDETNPIPPDPAPEAEPAPADNDETNPIPEVPLTSPQSLVPSPPSAPVPHTGVRDYNGRRLPLAAPAVPPQRHR